jgi:hypothetical protein
MPAVMQAVFHSLPASLPNENLKKFLKKIIFYIDEI